MSPKQIFTLVLAATALTAQIAFAAGTPSNVQNIQASLSEGKLKVEWNAIPEASFYRIYYSHQSILGNQGNYDDYEQTTTSEPMYSFTKLPLTSQEIFVSVLAVDQAGNESEGFETEASVRIQTSSSSVSSNTTAIASSSASAEPSLMPQGEFPTTTAELMNIATVSTLSSTGVLIVFTKNIQEGANITPAFFAIANSGGTALHITSLFINGQTALLTTEPQVPEREYRFRLLLPIPSGDGTHAIPSSQEIPFRGFGIALEEGTPSEPVNSQPDVPYGQNPILGERAPIQTMPPPQDKIEDPKPSDLPDSGIGLMSVFALAGAGAGMQLRKRK